MKVIIAGVLLLISVQLRAKTLQVPENCLSEKRVPCLVHVQDFQNYLIHVGTIQINSAPDTMMKWISFDEKAQVEVIKGKLHLNRVKSGAAEKAVAHGEKSKSDEAEKVSDPEVFVVNGIEIKSSAIMIHQESAVLRILDLNTFNESTYASANEKESPVLTKTRFLDKTELVTFVSSFFKTRNKLISFLKGIEKLWKNQFKTQGVAQTEALKRSIASVKEQADLAEAQRLEDQRKLKKVRELFFFRTFYR